MKQKNIILPLVLALVLGLLPFLGVFGAMLLTPDQYSHTFYGALDEKYLRLKNTDTKKIVVVGGSSVAFGLDSEMIQEATGYEVVNFGLYADLGTKIMLDLSRRHINEGDIVIIAPEMDEQTLSLYFNGSSALKATDDRPSMLLELDGDDWYDIWGALWGFIGEKWSYFVGDTPNPQGVYNAGNFNEYGDIDPEKFPRPENVMGAGYDAAKELHIAPETYSQDFIDYLNEYIDDLKGQGATVYYGFCPMNELAVTIDENSPFSKEDQISQMSGTLVTYLEENLHCPVLGTPEEAILPALYFYDSNFHLNDRGVPLHTAKLVDNLLKAEQKDPQNLLGAVKEQPGYTWSDKFFIYERTADGCAIIGTTPLSQGLQTIYVPATSEGVAITEITETAFADCRALSMLGFASEGSLTTVADGAFANTLSLNIFYFYGAPPTTFPSPEALGDPNALISATEEHMAAFEAAEAFSGYTKTTVRLAENVMVESFYDEVEEAENREVETTEDLYFIYTMMESGTWEITGLTELGKVTPVLVVPALAQSEAGEWSFVTSVGDYAMRGATEAYALVIPSSSLVSQFGLFVFAQSSVHRLYMFVDCTNITTTVSKNMVAGAPANFKICISDPERMNAYRTDYGWSTFTSDGYYEATTETEEELTTRWTEPQPQNNPKPMTITLIVLAIVGVAIAAGVILYWWLSEKKRQKSPSQPASDKEE